MQRSLLTRHLALSFTVAAALLRLGTNSLRLFNFTSVGAVGMYGGAKLRSWQAFAWPLLLMVATDAILTLLRGDGRYFLTDPSRPWAYASFVLYVLIGRFVINRSENPLR